MSSANTVKAKIVGRYHQEGSFDRRFRASRTLLSPSRRPPRYPGRRCLRWCYPHRCYSPRTKWVLCSSNALLYWPLRQKHREEIPHMQTNPFATEAAEYAHLRPTYPDELFEFLATVVASRNIAWDCATGNGQAATHLTKHFGQVIATDESGEMIAQAPPDSGITYRVAEAKDSRIEDHSVDLVTVASAIHWFDLDKFYA